MRRLALLLFISLALHGCSTVMLPHAETGRCYSVTHSYIIGWGYWLADGVDGWRCKDMKEGDLALVSDRPGVKPAEPPK